MKWMSTADFAQLIEDHFPATAKTVRELCEEGEIPPRFAKKGIGKERGHWKIAVKGIRFILESVLSLEPEEISEVQAKSPVNFSRSRAA